MKKKMIKPKFVEAIPEILEKDILYITLKFGTAGHSCPCECGEEVFTPITPTDWTLIWNGEFVTLEPSIGNWGFPCQSHYWIIENRIVWVRKFSSKEIELGRRRNFRSKARYYFKKLIKK